MDDLEISAALSTGSETPASQESVTPEPPSAANNYRGIEDDTTSTDAGQSDEAFSALEEGTGAPDPWAGYVEIELDGQILKVPEAFKDGAYRHKDYTVKTQTLAEERRQVEAQRDTLTQAMQFSEKELNLRVELDGMAAQLQRYEQVDWDAFEAQEPLTAQSEYRKYSQLQQQFNRRYGELQEAQTERSQVVERDLANRISATTDWAYKNLPGMSPEMDTKITDFAVRELGYEPGTLKQSYNPRIYRTLYLAHLGHQLLTRQAAQGRQPETSRPTQPLETVNTRNGNGGRKSIGEMDMDEYAAHRTAQQAKAGRR